MKVFITRPNISSLVFLLTMGLLFGIVSRSAQTSFQEDQSLPRWQVKRLGLRRLGRKPKDSLSPTERVIEDQIPSHLPIKVELKNLDSEPLLRNLEIKVTNTASKPIYYLKLHIILPEIEPPSGDVTGFTLRYGRIDLIDFQEPVQADDIPIQPGESHVFKIPEQRLKSLEKGLAKRHLSHSNIRWVYLMFQQINFGNKTGFGGTGGTPIPNLSGR